MDTVHIYTVSNWRLVHWLWPNGDWYNNRYMVYMDTDSSEHMDKLAKLRAVSLWLADQVAVYSASNYIGFTVHCELTRYKRG